MARPKILQLLRRHIREKLGTWPLDTVVPLTNGERAAVATKFQNLQRFDELLHSRAQQLNQFFLGMANSPFLLVFQSDEPDAFIAFADEHPTHNIDISWEATTNGHRQAWIKPINENGNYSLHFGLPETIENWIFGSPDRPTRLDRKANVLGDITIYRHQNGRDIVYRLTYDPYRTRRELRARGRELPRSVRANDGDM